MTDRRTWVPVAVALGIVAVIVGLFLLGRSDVEVASLMVTVPDGTEQLELDAAVYRPGGASADDPRPAVLLAHGFLGDRSGVDAQARRLAGDGFLVMTWSARGFGASGGRVGLADPAAEIADVSRLIDVLAELPEVRLDAVGDPRVAIVGGSYGAGTALLAAAQEPRLDAVVAAAGWHSLSRSLAPNGVRGPGEVAPGVLKTGWTSLLFTANALPADAFGPSSPEASSPEATTPDTDTRTPDRDPEVDVDPSAPPGAEDPSAAPDALDGGSDPCGRFSQEICELYLEIARGGVLTEPARELLDARSPAGRLEAVTAPTLLLQGQDDTLFDLTESRRNAEEIAAGGAPVRLRWIVGGHEIVGGAADDESREEIDAWLGQWLLDEEGPEHVAFTWTDQAADAVRDRAVLPDPPTPGGNGVREVLAFELTADGRLRERDGVAGAATDVPRDVMLTSPPGGQPAALSSLPGAGALVGFLPTTDIPGQHIAATSAPLSADVTLLGAPTMSLQVRSAEAADAPGAPTATLLDDGGEARLFVKLTDVAANGSATLIHQAVTPVRATALPRELDVELPDLAYRLRADHRLRVTIATTDQAFSNRLDGATTRLVLGDGAAQLHLPVVDSVTPAVRLPVVVGTVLAASALAALVWALRRRRGSASVGSSGGADSVDHPSGEPPTRAGSGRAAGGTPVTAAGREPPPVAVRGLTKRYADGHLAVDGFDLTVDHGQVVGLLGPNGSGKTTSLRMLLGLSTPTAGTVEVFGHDMRPGHPVLGRVGALVEGPGFVPELSGIDNLQQYWRAGGRRALDEADLPWALEVAALGDAIRKPVRTYSHGMKQRLAIAQALLGRPDLLVLDEPTDGLDPEQIRAMRELLARLGDEGHTVLVSSHLLAEVEQMCTHVAVVQRGRLLVSGSIGEVVGAGSTVVVETDDRDRARAVLARHLAPGSIEASGAGLAVTLGGHDPADLVTWLVADGLRIRALTPRGKLEDAFLALTGPPGSGTDGAPEPVGPRRSPGGGR